MHDAPPLAAGFPVPEAGAWRALAAKTLKDAPLDSLTSRTVEGLSIAPLYLSRGAERLNLPFRPHDADQPWDVRVATACPDPARANAEILADLEGGATSVLLYLDPKGRAGVAAGSAADLARALDNVVVELAPVALDAGFLGAKAADWLGTAAKSSPGAKLQFHLDPLSAFAQTGVSPGPVEAHLISAATVAARLSSVYPEADLFLASGRVVHEAGGGEAGELAFAAAAALAYAKALVRAGLPIERAFAGLTLGLSVDGDYFLSLAKLRAARAVWARITAACGIQLPARIEARSSRRMLAAQDPWTNMLRLTAAGFAAAAGGADAVVLGCFTDALGLPTAFARRQSRNIQFVLMEESQLGRVADPAAGSGYVEALTADFARAAWSRLQTIEANGGLLAALSSGLVAVDVEQARASRAAAGQPRIVGVTAFPPTAAETVAVETPQPRAVQAPDLRLPGPDGACPPLAPIRLAEPFENAA